MSKFKIEFYRDKEQDKLDTYNFFVGERSSNWAHRAICCAMPLHLVKNIVDDKANSKDDLFKHMDKEYETITENNLFVLSQKNTSDFWEQIADEFSSRIYDLTGKELDKYKCLLSLYLTTSAWNDSVNISRNITQLMQDKYLIAFEVILSHTFKCVREHYTESEIKNKWELWALSEITASLLIRDSKIKSLFKDLNLDVNESWFANTNYPFLAKHEEALKAFWNEKTSFKQYIDNAVDYFKENKVQVEKG